MHLLRFFLLAVVLGSSFNPAHAWWDPGHMVTAQIAYERLSKPARLQADSLVRVLMQDYPYTNNFVSAATWPDDLKAEGVHFYDHWHYTNIPYNPAGIKVAENPPQNVVWAINNCLSILKRRFARPIEKARALAFLIHFVGDIHQPLHCGSMYSNACPGGDLGGNLYNLNDPHGALHKLWDDGCGLTSELNNINVYGKPRKPLADSSMKRLKQFARKVTKQWPAKKLPELEETDPDFWALESHKLAVRYAYHGRNGESEGRTKYLKPGDEPGTEYLEKGKEIVARQLALGGYRLAEVLNGIWGR